MRVRKELGGGVADTEAEGVGIEAGGAVGKGGILLKTTVMIWF